MPNTDMLFNSLLGLATDMQGNTPCMNEELRKISGGIPITNKGESSLNRFQDDVLLDSFKQRLAFLGQTYAEIKLDASEFRVDVRANKPVLETDDVYSFVSSAVVTDITLIFNTDNFYVKATVGNDKFKLALKYQLDDIGLYVTDTFVKCTQEWITAIFSRKSPGSFMDRLTIGDNLIVSNMFETRELYELIHTPTNELDRVDSTWFLLTPEEVALAYKKLLHEYTINWDDWLKGRPVFCIDDGDIALCTLEGELVDVPMHLPYPAPTGRYAKK